MWISNQECSINLKVGVTCSQVPSFNFYNHALQPSLMTFSFQHDFTGLVNGEKQIKWQSCITRRRESLPHSKQLFTTHRFRYAASLLRRLWTTLMPTKIKLREIHYIMSCKDVRNSFISWRCQNHGTSRTSMYLNIHFVKV